MQLERKRKAATFLAQLAERKTTVSSVQPVEGVCFGHFKCVCHSVECEEKTLEIVWNPADDQCSGRYK